MELRVIRGERFLQAFDLLYEDISYGKLRQEIVRGFPNTTKRQHVARQVQIKSITYVPIDNGLQVNSTCDAGSESGTYDQTIVFNNVEYQPTSTSDNVTFTGTDGQEYNINQIFYRGNRVKVRCTCLDFYYRFANQDAGQDALHGALPLPYHKKTNNRPPVNPLNVPGICKHLIKVANTLRARNIVR